MIPPEDVARIGRALPFWASLGLVPVAAFAATTGGWSLILLPFATWWLFGLLDLLLGLNAQNADPQTPEDDLRWYRAITLIWAPVQFGLIFGTLVFVSWSGHLATWETVALFMGLGVLNGAIGIVYAHELMHQGSRLERWLGDVLMAMSLYGHFRSEHLLVHHRHVATPRDTVTARYGEGFHRFFLRVLPEGLRSAWAAEKAMLARRGLPWWDRANPFWRYGALQLAMLALALTLGGWAGLGLFLVQAFVGIWQLELINYIEHYGLIRKHLGEGRYERVLPRHSWNASHRASNWLLINLQRHSDHHYKPDRRYPLLQTYDASEAPQLPFGYPVMGMVALVPPLWRRLMHPRIRDWRQRHYPEISDWTPYVRGEMPLPRTA